MPADHRLVGQERSSSARGGLHALRLRRSLQTSNKLAFPCAASAHLVVCTTRRLSAALAGLACSASISERVTFLRSQLDPHVAPAATKLFVSREDAQSY